jgi:hypothetical protein
VIRVTVEPGAVIGFAEGDADADTGTPTARNTASTAATFGDFTPCLFPDP